MHLERSHSEAMAIETFWSERLRAERLHPEHLDLLCQMHADSRVMATLGGVRSEAETRQFLDRNLQRGLAAVPTKSDLTGNNQTPQVLQ